MTVFDERPFSNLARDGSVLPEGWAEVPLAELVIHRIGGEWGADAHAEGFIAVRVVRGTEFRDWEEDKGKTAARRFIQATHFAARELRPGDIVIEISGGGPEQPVGRTVLIDEEAILREPLPQPPLICGNFCRLLRLHPALDLAFIHLALRESYLRGDVWQFQNQTTNLRNLHFDEYLEGTFLRLPPLAEQRRIAAAAEKLLVRAAAARHGLLEARGAVRKLRQGILAAAAEGRMTEDWRRERARVLAAAEPAGTILAAILAEVVATRRKSFAGEERQAAMAGLRRPRAPFNLDPGVWHVPEPLSPPTLPDGWLLVPLQDLLQRLQYGTSKRADKKLKDGVPVLRMGNIRDGEIDLSDLKRIDPSAEDVPRFTLQKGDILFNRTNSPELVGKAAVFDCDLQAIFASYLVRLTCDERLVLPEYLCGWINSPWGRQWARTVRTDCVSQSNINAAKLRAMPVPLPPLDEQREIVRRTRSSFALADAVEEAIDHAFGETERLPRAILEQAMRGDLVPAEAELARLDGREHEPAEILLDRILADCQAAGAGRRKSPRRSLRGVTTEAVLALIRRISWGSVERSTEELIDAVAVRLKVAEPGPELRARLRELVEVAVERRILARKDGDRLVAATPKIGRYDDELLLGVLGKVMREGVSYDRKQLSRAVVSWLGYDQLTAAMLERMDDIFLEAIRRGLLVLEEGRYRFIHSKGS